MYRIMQRCALALFTLVMLASCGISGQPTPQAVSMPVISPSASPAPNASTEPKIGPQDTILTIRTRGGMCMNGACWSERQINADGSFTAADSTGAQTTGTLEATKVAELTQLIAATDFAQIKAQTFTGTCPIAYDGQEYIYTFQTVSGPQTLESCAVGIDDNSPLFQNIAGLIEVMNQQ